MAFRDKKSFDHVDAVETLLALGAVRVHAHALYAKVSGREKFRFIAAVKAMFAKALCQPYPGGCSHAFNLLGVVLLNLLLDIFVLLQEREDLVAYLESVGPDAC